MKLPHIGRHVDFTSMTLHDFLRGLILHMEKIIIESRLYPGWLIGSNNKVFYPEFIVEDKQITLDTSKMALTDMSGLTYPAIWIHKKLAYELGWFVDNPEEQDPQFAVKLGPNLVMKVNNYEIPRTSDIKSDFTADGHAQNVTHSDKHWIIPRWANGSL